MGDFRDLPSSDIEIIQFFGIKLVQLTNGGLNFEPPAKFRNDFIEQHSIIFPGNVCLQLAKQIREPFVPCPLSTPKRGE